MKLFLITGIKQGARLIVPVVTIVIGVQSIIALITGTILGTGWLCGKGLGAYRNRAAKKAMAGTHEPKIVNVKAEAEKVA